MRKKYKVNDCPFCNDNINEMAFLESKNFFVIYNNSPILPGHSLVIPKFHIESLLNLTEKEQNELVNISIKAAKLILKVFNAESFNWTIQERPAAGQTVQHLHLHIFPRHENDLPAPGDWYPLLKQNEENQTIDNENRQRLSEKEVREIVKNIKKQIV